MIIFATIFGLGFVILIFNLIFGHDFDTDVDIDASDLMGPSIFSLKMIALLMVGFGATSFALHATTRSSMMQSSLAGIGGAVVIGAIGYLIIRAFYVSQASSTITDQNVLGCDANVIDTIPAEGNGQITCIVKGREITFLARSSDGTEIAKGTPVNIKLKTGNVVTVEIIK